MPAIVLYGGHIKKNSIGVFCAAVKADSGASNRRKKEDTDIHVLRRVGILWTLKGTVLEHHPGQVKRLWCEVQAKFIHFSDKWGVPPSATRYCMSKLQVFLVHVSEAVFRVIQLAILAPHLLPMHVNFSKLGSGVSGDCLTSHGDWWREHFAIMLWEPPQRCRPLHRARISRTSGHTKYLYCSSLGSSVSRNAIPQSSLATNSHPRSCSILYARRTKYDSPIIVSFPSSFFETRYTHNFYQ